ncbi:MAG: lysine--tRNA ligase [Candidatus Thalassarchaeaceae archaeon]|nr:lysine--tRNA ligase [Candidatus Thalassarchaeaceae archaeon]
MHWAEFFASKMPGKGTQRIAAGITPSGEFHIGHLREILTCDIIFRAYSNTAGKKFEDLAKSDREGNGNQGKYVEVSEKEFFEWEKKVVQERIENEDFVEFIFIVDNADPLRKVYPFLDPDYEEFIGHQLGNIPPPDSNGKPDYARFDDGRGESYADHFLSPFIEALKKIGVRPVMIYNLELYNSGDYAEYIDVALSKSEEIREIITNISGRELPENWFPFNPLDSNGNLDGIAVTKYEKPFVYWVDQNGNEGKSDITSGNVGKLPWRVEWAAKWALLQVSCEPFGKDHGASGGSYDTGKEIVKIFDNSSGEPCEAPFPLTYEWISIKGGGVMSSSTGNSIGPLDVLELVPPEIIRFLIAKNQPKRHIDFDTGSCLIELSDEYQQAIEKLDEGTPENFEKLSRRQQNAFTNLISTIAYSQVEDITRYGFADVSSIDDVLDFASSTHSVPFRHLALLAQMYPDDCDVWQSLFDSNMIQESYQLLMELGGQNIGSPYIVKAGFVISQDDFDYEKFLSENPNNEADLDKLRDRDDTRERAAWEIYSRKMVAEEGWRNGVVSGLPRRLKTIRNWINSEHFPEGHRLRIQTELSDEAKENIDGRDVDYLQALRDSLTDCNWDTKSINDNVCNLAKERGKKLSDTFQLLYWIVLGRSYGPKLKSILSQMKRQAVLDLLQLAIDELAP